jgi:hypothetical protein
VRSIIAAAASPDRLQRAIVVTLATIPLLLVTMCCAPAIILQPFLPGGTDRAIKIITAVASWAKGILDDSKIA